MPTPDRLAELIVGLLYMVEPIGVGKKGEGVQIFADLKSPPPKKKLETNYFSLLEVYSPQLSPLAQVQ